MIPSGCAAASQLAEPHQVVPSYDARQPQNSSEFNRSGVPAQAVGLLDRLEAVASADGTNHGGDVYAGPGDAGLDRPYGCRVA